MFKKAFVTSLMSIFLVMGFSKAAFASSIFDGGAYWGSTSDNIGGARAYISYTSKPVVYNSAASCAWTMINDTSGHLAQVGWAVENSINSGQVHYFFAYINTTSGYVERDSSTGPALGSLHNYYTDLSSGVASGYVDSTKIANVNIDWTPVGTQYFGEITDNGGNPTNAQLPGRTSMHEALSSVQIWKNSQWMQPSLSWGDTGTIIGRDTSSYSTNGLFQIWDTRY